MSGPDVPDCSSSAGSTDPPAPEDVQPAISPARDRLVDRESRADLDGRDATESLTGGGFALATREILKNKLAVVGLVVVLAALIFCFLGPVLYHTNQTDAQAVLLSNTPVDAPPGAGHPLGTDHAGFDILGRLMFGGRNSLAVGFAAAALATIWGVIYGALSGYLSGWKDALLMRFLDLLLSIPALFFLIVLSVVFRPSRAALILIIAFVAWLIPARLVRGETLTLRTRGYVEAAQGMGSGNVSIIFRHIIPNAVGTIAVSATLQIADAILLLGALGFLSLGIQAPQTDWGSMLANASTTALNGRWWEIYPAGVCILLVVVSLNFVADALRDSLEVRLQPG